jgi:hypothetical protein
MPIAHSMSADPVTLGGLRGKLAIPELRELPKLLQPGEDVLSLVQGWFRGDAGVLVATTQRLLFLNKGWLYGLHYEQFQYAQLTAVQYDGGLVWARITILGPGASADIERTPGDAAREFCDLVQPLLGRPARVPVAVAAALALVIWVLGQDLGQLYTGQANRPEYGAAHRATGDRDPRPVPSGPARSCSCSRRPRS